MDEYREASSRGNRQHEPSARPGMAPEEEALIQQAYVPILYEDLVGQPGPIGRLAKPRAARRGRHQRPFTPTSPRPMAFELRAQSRSKTIMQVGTSQNQLRLISWNYIYVSRTLLQEPCICCHSIPCVQTRRSQPFHHFVSQKSRLGSLSTAAGCACCCSFSCSLGWRCAARWHVLRYVACDRPVLSHTFNRLHTG